MHPKALIHTIWQSQCAATEGIQQRYGAVRALEYLVGEKLMHYAEACEGDATLAPSLVAFVAEVRRLFSKQELQTYLDDLEQQKIVAAALPLDEDDPLDTVKRRQSECERLSWVKSMALGSAS